MGTVFGAVESAQRALKETVGAYQATKKTEDEVVFAGKATVKDAQMHRLRPVESARRAVKEMSEVYSASHA